MKNHHKYRCAIIGCGTIAGTHLQVIHDHPDLECVAICDIDAAAMAKMDDQYGPFKKTEKAEELMDPNEIDLLLVLSDHQSHAKWVCQAIKSGVKVICEKPLTAHPDDLEKILMAHREYPEVYVGGIFQNRFNVAFQTLRAWIHEGRLGDLLQLQLTHRCYRSHEYYTNSPWRGTVAQEGGSVAINQSIHFMDFLLQLGGTARQICANVSNMAHLDCIETEDTASGLLLFENGAHGSFAITNGSAENWTWEINCVGTKATVCINKDGLVFPNGTELEKEWSLKEMSPSAQPLIGKDYYGNGHYHNLNDHVQAMKGERQAEVDIISAARSTHLIHKLYESSRLGTWAKLDF